MDQTPYSNQKYIVKRSDGKDVGCTFVIEIDKDPQAAELLLEIAGVYKETRPLLAASLLALSVEIMTAGGR